MCIGCIGKSTYFNVTISMCFTYPCQKCHYPACMVSTRVPANLRCYQARTLSWVKAISADKWSLSAGLDLLPWFSLCSALKLQVKSIHHMSPQKICELDEKVAQIVTQGMGDSNKFCGRLAWLILAHALIVPRRKSGSRLAGAILWQSWKIKKILETLGISGGRLAIAMFAIIK